MTRYWAIAALALFAAAAGFSQGGGQKDKDKDKDKDINVQGTFSKDDPRDAARGGPSQLHTVKMKAGKRYTIDMISTNVDSYLRLQDPKGNEIAEDDDSGGNLNAQIIFNCTADGDYKIICTTFGGDMNNGAYTLKVKVSGAAPPPTSTHAKLLGKDAPDFKADFAINGKPGKLSDLKGKVVLFYFWEVRSSSSTALFPKLAEWNKAYKDKGLVIAGATFYPSEIDQKLGWDAEAGELTTVKKADKKSDQALLKAFADHHKIDHLLLALPKQVANEAFDVYAVDGLPVMVLLDRKGAVRLVEVGGEKASAFVESEMKKLLAEK